MASLLALGGGQAVTAVAFGLLVVVLMILGSKAEAAVSCGEVELHVNPVAAASLVEAPDGATVALRSALLEASAEEPAAPPARSRIRDAVAASIRLAIWGSDAAAMSEQAEHVDTLEHTADLHTALLGAQRVEAHVAESEEEPPKQTPTHCASPTSLAAGAAAVPGMVEANFVVSVATDVQLYKPASAQNGVERLMGRPGGEILAAMAQSGWKVEPNDPARNIYDVFLPSVEYNLGMGSVGIPAPRFTATIVDTFRETACGHERLEGELVLQNGKDILTVILGFPFFTTISLSAAGVARARLGRQGDAVFVQADVEFGIQLPRVPGLAKIMQIFVRTYANQSILDCARALAHAADADAPASGRLVAHERSEIAVASSTKIPDLLEAVFGSNI